MNYKMNKKRWRIQLFIVCLIFTFKSFAQVEVVSVIPPTSTGACDGQIVLNEITGSSGPYTYQWIHPTFTADNCVAWAASGWEGASGEAIDFCTQSSGLTLNNLCTEGTYTLVITNVYGCAKTMNIDLGTCDDMNIEIIGTNTFCPEDIHAYYVQVNNGQALEGSLTWQVNGNVINEEEVYAESWQLPGYLVQWASDASGHTLSVEYNLNGCTYTAQKTIYENGYMACSDDIGEWGGDGNIGLLIDHTYNHFSGNCSGPLNHLIEGYEMKEEVKQIPIVFHMVQTKENGADSDFKDYVTTLVEKVNILYEENKTQIKFELASQKRGREVFKGVNYIEDAFAKTEFRNVDELLIRYDELVRKNFWEGCINIFYTPQKFSYGNPYLGRIHMEANEVNLTIPDGLAMHLGEALGLLSTDTGGCAENVDGKLCQLTGDYICDTAPIEKCSGQNIRSCHFYDECGYYSTCRNTRGTEVDNAVFNMMNLTDSKCKSSFTREQIIRMHALLENKVCEHIYNKEVKEGFGVYYFDYSYLTSKENLEKNGIKIEEPTRFLYSAKREVKQDFFVHSINPNPFSNEAILQFEIADKQAITLEVIDLSGRVISTLLELEVLDKGKHEVNIKGSEMTAGYYFYRLKTANHEGIGKMIIVE